MKKTKVIIYPTFSHHKEFVHYLHYKNGLEKQM
jgi:hypothetical protein